MTDASGVTAEVIDGFVTCGDLSGWDSEKSYPLDIDVCFPSANLDEEDKKRYEFKDVVQPPTDPAYKEALEMKKSGIFSKMNADMTKEVIEHFSGEKSDIVICDGAPDVTGIHSLDEFMQAELILAAFNITSHVLKIGGNFLAKIFRSRNSSLLYAQMKKYFKKVYLAKPRSSRQSSCEAFVLCLDYSPPEGFVPTMGKSSLEMTDASGVTAEVIDGFVMCGDLSG
ncbi:hypothetical protein CAEBREN_09527 [Caenorhabditis brenneri]|uniref:Ribosomal RNA methyltransferase FtsJ domain-containing protein n=1 Tax=Caenorhabditis brenneri TaxID=135651 RepID=G0MBR9_CAEBE|nr:hypothetical protein CAEBREN_09527 [Caenorhabditis brenneri]